MAGSERYSQPQWLGDEIKDIQGRKILSNFRDQYAMGVQSEAEALGKTDRDIYPPEIAAKFVAEDELVLRDGKIFEIESTYMDASGQPR